MCVVTKLIDLDISCTNNCRHKVKMDNISSSVLKFYMPQKHNVEQTLIARLPRKYK